MPTTRVLVVDRDDPDPIALDQAAAILHRGGLVAFATETVYGLGADATRTDAVQRIFDAKGRPADNPLIVHVADVTMARRYAAHWSDDAERLAAAAWPGPLTIVVPKTEAIAALVTGGLSTVGLRVPAPVVARALLRATDRPLAAPSANRSEHVSPTQAAHVLADLDGRVDLILDSGPTEVGIESTVVDLSSDEPRVLRPGPLSVATLSTWLGRPVAPPADLDGPARSPGQRPRHYAPRSPTLRVDSLQALAAVPRSDRDIVLVFGASVHTLPAPRSRLVTHADPTTAARELYGLLRHCDALAPARILVVMPPAEPAWDAVRDRLIRATTPA